MLVKYGILASHNLQAYEGKLSAGEMKFMKPSAKYTTGTKKEN